MGKQNLTKEVVFDVKLEVYPNAVGNDIFQHKTPEKFFERLAECLADEIRFWDGVKEVDWRFVENREGE